MNYEILYIIPAKYSETEFEKINKKIPAILEEAGGKIIKINNWGKRKFAYQIKQFRYGYYVLIIFSAPSKALEKINKKLNLNQDILRFQIVKEIKQGKRKAVTVDSDNYMVNKDGVKPKRTEKKFNHKKEKTREKVLKEKIEKEEIKKNKDQKKNEEETKKEETKQPQNKKEKIEKKKAGRDKLDEKLDELLNNTL